VRRWREAASWSDEQLAAAIVDDRIDILIDLSGHTAGSRLAVFARRPAPVQLTWMGYVGTTGLKAMDGLIADRFHVPAGEEAAYVERVLRLPDTLFCFDPPTETPAVSPLPASSGRPFCFGCFHNPAKINRGVADLWARILAAVPGASAYFAYAGYDVAEVQQRIRGWFADAGIAPDRIRFGGRLPRREHLARYGEVDLALDPFPYSGSTTTAEALWMGVPVVTMPGQSFAGRHSLSHLSVIGLTETIACDAEDYLARACGVAGDLDRLAILRAGLRERVAASPLCDGDRFARHLAAMLREVWLSRCEGAAARPQVSSQ
jgi:predicted O-linked N-acetylglucosamine transferase (SPINDLY family)